MRRTEIETSYRIVSRRNWLLVIPLITYLAAYCYLAMYHEKWWLLTTIIHEGGTLKLWETILYASHFLGHVPSLTVVALLFVGSVRLFFVGRADDRAHSWTLWTGLVALLGFSIWFSVLYFGWEQTGEYIFQQRQGEHRLEQGGSWLLHLPTTLLLFAGLPVYVAIAGHLLGHRLQWNVRAGRWFLTAGLLTLLMTILCCEDAISSFMSTWKDARYLAHSVRELATYPLIFFSLPLYLYCRNFQSGEAGGDEDVRFNRRGKRAILGLAVLALAGLVWQVITPLKAGVSGLAQHPSFAHGGDLSIAYLLASHYFEHVLDTIYFTLLCGLLLRWPGFRRAAQ